MKSLFVSLIFLLIVQIGNSQTIFDFELETTQGDYNTFSELRGSKVTIIDFWATWCKPCVKSIPKLAELAKNYSPDEVSFIGISIDSPRNISKIQPFVQSVGVTYPILLDSNQELMRELNVTVIPTLLVINSKNEVIHIHEGYAPGDEHILEKQINTLINESK